jgi:hypothetical protein
MISTEELEDLLASTNEIRLDAKAHIVKTQKNLDLSNALLDRSRRLHATAQALTFVNLALAAYLFWKVMA